MSGRCDKHWFDYSGSECPACKNDNESARRNAETAHRRKVEKLLERQAEIAEHSVEQARQDERRWLGEWLENLVIHSNVVYGIWEQYIQELKEGRRP